jgi:hypothetical protein
VEAALQEGISGYNRIKQEDALLFAIFGGCGGFDHHDHG